MVLFRFFSTFPGCLLTVLVFAALLVGCGSKQKKLSDQPPARSNQPLPYDLARPSQRYVLPRDLHEVSGLAYYRPGRLALVQDELAVVFIYDLARKMVVDEHVFGRQGDYEGVEFVNNELYVLRADGELYHFVPTEGVKTFGAGKNAISHIKINLPGKNEVEGLGYDPKLNALLLAVKEPAKGNPDKPIYLYDLKQATLWQGPVLRQTAVAELSGLETKAELKPSGIAVHPVTGRYYLLAANGRRLIIMDRRGQLYSSVALDKRLMPQAEGICFAPDGTLFIASEGKSKNGQLLAFAPR